MKQFITQFKISILLGLTLFASTSFPVLTQTSTARRDQIVSEALMPSDLAPTPVPDWQAELETPLVFSALNPGYTVNKIGDVGEFIELKNLSNEIIDLSDYSITYTNGKGNTSTIVEFPAGSRLEGQTLLLRLARRAEPGTYDLTYTTAIALSAGPLSLVYRGQVVDSVCWTGAEDCYDPFQSDEDKRTTLARDLELGTFAHIKDYQPDFNSEQPGIVLPPVVDGPEEPDDDLDGNFPPSSSTECYKLEFSEVLSYYRQASTEQFIELYNPSDSSLQLDGCALRYKKKTYALSGTVAAGGYYTFAPASANFSLTKNPTSSNLIELVNGSGEVIDSLEYYHGQKQQTSYAKFYDNNGAETWLLTFQPTPNTANLYQEFRSCSDGKVINPETGNCVKATNTAATACPAGKYRNPLTGRCKNIESAATQKECAEGYERNPETNRCRKIKTANEGADYALIPTTYSDQKSFVGLGIVITLVCLGVGYIILQFRREIARAMRKARQSIYHFGKDLRSGKIVHRNRHK